MNQVEISHIVEVPEALFERRGFPHENIGRVIDWIDGNPDKFNWYIIGLDEAINTFNQTPFSEVNPAFQNTLLVKTILGNTPLPTVASFALDYEHRPEEKQRLTPEQYAFGQNIRYLKTVKHVADLMEAGEIGYQKRETDTETLTVATIMQVYEEMAKASPALSDKQFEPDRIIEALMEIASERLSLWLFQPLAAKKGMDWVDGNDRFSEEFRRRMGFGHKENAEGSYHPLDMAPTIDWYTRESNRLMAAMPMITSSHPSFPIQNPEHFLLADGQIGALIDLFPKNARDRSTLRKLEGRPLAYFDKSSTFGKPVPTSKVEDAISSTAFAPAATEYSRDLQTNEIKSTISLFEIPADINPKVVQIILAEALIHEYAHTIMAPILYAPGYKLVLGNEDVVDAKDFIERFVQMEEAHTPFSHYSEGYRAKGGKFSDAPDRKTAINEELSEAITAELLGFVFCDEPNRRLDPFSDRPEVQEFVREFLNAQKVR